MPKLGRLEKPVFRIFLSSTFEDFREERNALHREVFPRLTQYCRSQGFDFQVIDLRWGIAEQAALNQQTVNICLEEIQRCQDLSPKPNFLVMLGDRYGWCPPPAQIPVEEFELLIQETPPSAQPLLENWYRRDDNAVPSEYCLLPRDPEGPYRSYSAWQPVETELRDTLLAAAQKAGFGKDALAKYQHSATHQEISAGALSVPDAEDHVLCFFRTIADLPVSSTAGTYCDLRSGKNDFLINSDSKELLTQLKTDLEKQIGKNVFKYQAQWQDDHPSTDHLPDLCAEVYRELKRIIDLAIQEPERRKQAGSVEEEQTQILKEQVVDFSGRDKLLAELEALIDSSQSSPILLRGKQGSGKSSVIGKLIQNVQQKPENRFPVFRFVGATPDTTEAVSLFSGLCREIYAKFNLEAHKARRLDGVIRGSSNEAQKIAAIERDYYIPSDLDRLLLVFQRFLAAASETDSILIVIDGLDKLSDRSIRQFAQWLPADFPENIRFLFSLSEGEFCTLLQERLPRIRQVQLQSLSREDGSRILDSWLTRERRDLQDFQKDLILDHFVESGEGLPLYLRLAFTQAVHWKSYQDQDELSLGLNVNELVENFLDRLSSADQHGLPLVSKTIGYLNSSQYGLTEDELLDLLSRDPDLYSWFVQNVYHFPQDLMQEARDLISKNKSDDGEVSNLEVTSWLQDLQKDPPALLAFLEGLHANGRYLRLPIALWSRLFVDIKSFLVLRKGDGKELLRFSLPAIAEIGNTRYLSPGVRQEHHQRIAEYFSRQDTLQGKGIYNLRKLSELPFQQTCGNQFDSLKETLLDFEFLDAKVQTFGPEVLIGDFRRAEASGFTDETLQTIQSALQLSAHVLELDPKQMPGQLVGRLSAIDQEQIQSFLSEVKDWKGRAWLRPLSSSLRSPGGALVRAYSEFRGSHIGLNAGSILIGNDQGDIIQISSPDYHLSTRLLNQGGQLVPLGLDADGSWVLVREGENRLGVLDLDSSDSLRLIGETGGEIRSAARIPGSEIIMASIADGILEAWDLETSQRIFLLPEVDSRIVELLPVKSLQCVISVHWDGTINHWGYSQADGLYERDTRTVPLTSEFPADSITAAALTGEDAGLLIGFRDGTIGFFDLGGEKVSERFKIHSEWVTAFTLFPDGKMCLSGAIDGSLIVWDVESGVQMARYEGHNYHVESITINPTAEMAITSSEYDLKFWDLSSAEIHQQGEKVTALAISPDGKKAVAASDTRYAYNSVDTDSILSVLDLTTGQLENRVSLGRHFWVNDLDIFSDNRRVMCACMYWRQSLIIFDLKTGKPILPLPYDRSSFSVQIYGNGSKVISGGEDSTVRIWDLEAFTEVARLEGHSDEVNAVCLYDSGAKACSVSADGTLRIWDLESFQQLKVIETKFGFRDITDIQVLDEGRLALTTGRGIKLWDLEQGVLINSLPFVAGSSTQLPLEADDKPLISGIDGRRFCIIDPDTGELIADFWGEGEGMSCSASAPDGSTFAAGGSSGAVHVLKLITPER